MGYMFLLFITPLIIITLILKGIVMFLSLTGILMILYVCLLEKNNLHKFRIFAQILQNIICTNFALFRINAKKKKKSWHKTGLLLYGL